jgi:ferritin-like metal-binding protein YciE
MFERLNTPSELYNHNLGAALKMEQTVLDMLGDNIEAAQDERVKQLLHHHQDETRRHVEHVEEVFALFGWEVDTSPCPAIQGIEKEGKANVKMADDSVVDAVILAGAAETEHHEIAVYENLITHARAMGRDDAVALLRENLENEQHTLGEVHAEVERIAAATPAPTV